MDKICRRSAPGHKQEFAAWRLEAAAFMFQRAPFLQLQDLRLA
jgi:hypothetical protein